MRDHWTDDRMDDLSRRMDQGFDRVDTDLRALRQEVREQGKELRAETTDLGKSLRGEMGARFDSMNARFDSMEARFDAMQHLLIQVAGGLVAAFLAGLLGLIATQL